MILRDLAAAWVMANCPRLDVQENFLKHLDGAIQSRVNCSFMIGRDLIGVGKPFLVSCFCGEFFAFELTRQQTARLKVTDNVVVSARGAREYDQGPKPTPTVSFGAHRGQPSRSTRPVVADYRNAAIPN